MSLALVNLHYRLLKAQQRINDRKLYRRYKALCIQMMDARDEGHTYKGIAKETGGYNARDVSRMVNIARRMIEAGRW